MERKARNMNSIKFSILPFLLCLLTSVSVSGQSRTVSGTVVDSDGKAIASVNIVSSSGRGTSSDARGYFRLTRLDDRDTVLTFSHLAYVSQLLKLNASLENEQVLSITLLSRSQSLPSVVVDANRKIIPDTVVQSTQFSIADFEFYQDTLVLLTYLNQPEKKQSLVFSSYNGDPYYAISVPDGPFELFKDYLGRMILVGQEEVLLLNETKRILIPISAEKFQQQLRPCLDTLSGNILFTDYSRHFPAFSYYAYLEEQDTAIAFCFVEDEPLHRMYRYEYYFLKPHEKLFAMKLADELMVDKHTVAAHMTGFTNSWYFDPLFAPLFVKGDTIIVFDHYKNLLFRFSSDLAVLDSTEISYHKTKRRREWRREILYDEEKGNLYGLFLANDNYQELRKINSETGEIEGVHKLYYRYADKIRVKDGFVYYTYHPFESVQKKFLYRELLPFD